LSLLKDSLGEGIEAVQLSLLTAA